MQSIYKDCQTDVNPESNLSSREIRALDAYFRATNYLVAAQLYLHENVLLEVPLKLEHIKDPVLGHWGTAPGVNFVYTHVNHLVKAHDATVLLVVGPGHAAPAVLANLYLEGTLKQYYPSMTLDRIGLTTFIQSFGLPDRFPTELSPVIPGCIHEGGELGYALSVAFGTVLDNPNLITICVIGDGEAETGPTASAWHSAKFLNPISCGAVLPILHRNSYRMTSPSIYGTMSDDEILTLFRGLGYIPRIVPGDHNEMYVAIEWAFNEIRMIQRRAREKGEVTRFRWPMLVLCTPKGWTGPEWFQGRKIEGTHRSHKAPIRITKAVSDVDALAAVEVWLKGYKPWNLFDAEGRPKLDVLSVLPHSDKRLGMTAQISFEKSYTELSIPSWKHLAIEVVSPGTVTAKSAEVMAGMLKKVIVLNRNNRNFRIFSPDELDSNLLGELLEETGRCFISHNTEYGGQFDPDGRIMEVLSEHLCQGWLQGYLLSGRHGVFPSYECFIPIVSSMVSQFVKFVMQSHSVKWRPKLPSLNFFLTSLGWRNNYSHQNPDFYQTLLSKYGSFIKIYFPPDANTLLACTEESLRSRGRINVLVSAKTLLPQWTQIDEAIYLAKKGVGVWHWASTSGEAEPDIVLAAAGDYVTRECLAAIAILRAELPRLKIRYVSICELTCIGSSDQFSVVISDGEFEQIFTSSSPVILSFGGYPMGIKGLLFSRTNAHRFTVLGYRDQGTTTTELDMLIRNGVSRYNLVITAAAILWREGLISREEKDSLEYKNRHEIQESQSYIARHRHDPYDVNRCTINQHK